MKIMMAMMYMLPKKVRDRIKAPMVQRGRYEYGKKSSNH